MHNPISLSHVTHRYNHKAVLDDITVSLGNNLITGILGKSGSGKSTLLKIINGMVRPIDGDVHVLGKNIDYQKMDDLRLQIGYVVQQVGLFPHMSIEKNIGLLGKICRYSREEILRRTSQLLEMVQLPNSYLPKYPHELSGGEQQRVGICRAMFLNPPIILMDEPFGSLDYETKRHIYRQLKRIQEQEPRSILLVTHDWDEAITLADEFLWIQAGQIKEQGNNDELKRLHAKIFP